MYALYIYINYLKYEATAKEYEGMYVEIIERKREGEREGRKKKKA